MQVLSSAFKCAIAVAALTACGAQGTTLGSGGSSSGRGGTGGTIFGFGGSLATGGTLGAGGSFGSGGFGGTGITVKPPCEQSPSQTVIIGDSYINWVSHNFLGQLATLAGETYRNYSVGGASLASGGIATLIPAQFDQAVLADRNIQNVVMDGGGNDALICDAVQFPGCASCKDGNIVPVCNQVVQKATSTFSTLLQHMASVGVKEVVYFWYPDVPTGTLIGGANPNTIAHLARPTYQQICTGAAAATGGQLACHFVDMGPVFAGHPEYFAVADIHPNTLGSQAMAQAVWTEMKNDCIAQKSGCCQ